VRFREMKARGENPLRRFGKGSFAGPFDFVTASLTRSSHFAQDDKLERDVHQPIFFRSSVMCAV
jgi:hypothetical protein